MNSMDLSMLLYGKEQSGDLKCANFEEMHSSTESGVDAGNDESSESSCGIQEESMHNSTNNFHNMVMNDSAGTRSEPSSSSTNATGHHISSQQTGCTPSSSALLNSTDAGRAYYKSAYINGGMSGVLPIQPTLPIRPYPSTPHKMKREWRNIGWFTSDAEMNEVRKREKVSKRKSVAQINGIKVFYRCNNWRRTNCNFRMYAMYHAPDRISLNASGEHDHTTKNPHYVPRNYTGNMIYNMAPSSSHQQMLDQFVLHATANRSMPITSNDQENVFETKNIKDDSAQIPQYFGSVIKTGVEGDSRQTSNYESAFQLCDGQSIAQLLQLAKEIDHTFTFNSRRNSEYCFESNVMRGKVVAFADLGAVVSVVERCNGVQRSCEHWRKADWNQFLWAVRGKCAIATKRV
uniref:FLYWCH-type domain-containing protein n=1 Tax=Parascaris univalens TaxID=6257 RepID=A0A915CCM9_PARUN